MVANHEKLVIKIESTCVFPQQVDTALALSVQTHLLTQMDTFKTVTSYCDLSNKYSLMQTPHKLQLET